MTRVIVLKKNSDIVEKKVSENIDINICKLTIKFLGRSFMNEQINKEDECCKNSCSSHGLTDTD